MVDAAVIAPRRSLLRTLIPLPLILGVLATLLLYAAIPHLPVYSDLAQRYLCSHPLEYATTALFCIAVCVLGAKALAMVGENKIFKRNVLDGVVASSDHSVTADRLAAKVEELPEAAQNTWLVGRIWDVAGHVRSRRTAAGLDGQLKYFGEQAADRSHSGFAFVRTITWAVPILGFLGTVIGITIAIANVTPDQLDSSLGEVTGGLAVAFDTTALALALSLGLVFCSFVVERNEQNLLARVEDFAATQLAPLFPSVPQGEAGRPLLAAEAAAAEHLLEKTESLIDQQVGVWNESLETMRTRWNEMLTAQQADLGAALTQGVEATLTDHVEQLATARHDFLDAFKTASADLRHGLAVAQEAGRDMQESFASRLDTLWSNIQSGVVRLRDQQSSELQKLGEAIDSRVGEWQTHLTECTASSTEQLEAIRLQQETLMHVAEQENQIIRLQDRLNDNLSAVRNAGSFEETLHSLSAAVHLLTARVGDSRRAA